MAIFKYDVTKMVNSEEKVYLKIVHPKVGTVSKTVVDLPHNDDLEAENEAVLFLGTGTELEKERTLIYTKLTNLNENDLNVELEYYLNDQIVVEHSNPKNIDPTPQLKTRVKFVVE